ncbi:MAG TPA: RNA polymerase sigma factor [Planctomycetota bacterium]|nr:RNA polymerase sigma factor [Planctomycetota bacterium]
MASTDADLVVAARAGDRAAFAELAERHGERLRRFLATMTGDDAAAEDLRQDTLRLALERRDQLADPARFPGWLLAIAVNRCRTHLRQKVQRRAAGDEVLEQLPDHGRRSALSSIVRRESAELLALAIDRLPILLREAFVLFHQEQLPYADIAALSGASEGTLQVRVHRARALLRQQLGSVVDTFWQRAN